MSSILLTDNNRTLADFLSKSLEPEGCSVHTALNEDSVISELQHQNHKLVILDLSFGHADGLKLLEKLRAARLEIPVMVLSAHHNDADRKQLLNLGADDYLIRPFSFQELAERANALLRRTADPSLRALRVGALELDPASRKVHRGAREIELSSREFEILYILMQRPGVPVSRHELIKHLREGAASYWAGVCISNLRKKIDLPNEERLIFKKRGLGYQIGQSTPAINSTGGAGARTHLGKDLGAAPFPAHNVDLSKLRRESDSLLDRMQRPESRAAMQAAYNASPEQLGKAALAAVRMRKRG
jgi:DNA-binding response OmpR family regulator